MKRSFYKTPVPYLVIDNFFDEDTLNDIIKFRFKQVSFIVEDLDPLNDDWVDEGIDGCLDILEDGEGGCITLQEEPIYSNTNLDPNGDNYNDEDNSIGTQGNNQYDEGEGIEGNWTFDIDYESFEDYGTGWR